MRHLSIRVLSESTIIPTRSTNGSVGYDLSACIDTNLILEPDETKLIGAGFALELEQGFAAFIYARSGLGIKSGIVPANCVGVIDSDYRGEVKIGLKNTSKEPFIIRPGDRIAQMVISQCELPEIIICNELSETARSDGGFGSSGI